MNLRESIVSRGLNYTGSNFEENYFFSNLAKGYIKDRKVFGEETIDIYTNVFGSKATPIFEAFEENADVLEEAINSSNGNLLFEADVGASNPINNWVGRSGDRAFSPAKSNFSDIGSNLAAKSAQPNVGDLASDTVTKSGRFGVLSTLWDSIKKFGSGLAAKFPGVASFLKNGISWITGHPAIVLGVAGGAALLKGVINALRKKGQNKKAAELEEKLKASGKDKETEKK